MAVPRKLCNYRSTVVIVVTVGSRLQLAVCVLTDSSAA